MTAAALPPEVRSPAATRANRIVLLLLGLLLLAGGTVALLTGLGVFGADRADEPVLSGEAVRFADRNAGWLWPLVAGAAVVVGLLALRWLLSQARTNRVSALSVEEDTSRGETRLDGGALTDVVSEEIGSYPGVAAATARLVDGDAAPRLDVRVQLDGRVDARGVRRRVEADALAHVRTALSAPALPARVELVVPRHPARPARDLGHLRLDHP